MDSCESERVGPAADPGEEMPLSMPGNVGWDEVGDGASVDASWGNEAMGLEVLQPVGCELGVLVVEGGRHPQSPHSQDPISIRSR